MPSLPARLCAWLLAALRSRLWPRSLVLRRKLLARLPAPGASVRVLDVADNRVVALPPDLAPFRRLEVLNLQGNGLRAVPPGVAALAALTHLNLAFNSLTELPEEARPRGRAERRRCTPPPSPPSLPHTHTAPVVALSVSLRPFVQAGHLPRLVSLGLKSNQLRSLPPGFGSRLPCLVALYLTDNRLTALPAALGRLGSLKKLQAASNRLTSARARGPL